MKISKGTIAGLAAVWAGLLELLGVLSLFALSTVGTPCPSTIPLYAISGSMQQVGTATLYPAATAAQVNGVSSYQGLLATYNLGSFTVGSVAYPDLGGIVGSHYALLGGYHYNADGSCTAYTPSTPTSTRTATTTSTASATSTGNLGGVNLPSPKLATDPVDFGLGVILLIVGVVLVQRGRKK